MGLISKQRTTYFALDEVATGCPGGSTIIRARKLKFSANLNLLLQGFVGTTCVMGSKLTRRTLGRIDLSAPCVQ